MPFWPSEKPVPITGPAECPDAMASTEPLAPAEPALDVAGLLGALGGRHVVLVGLMGAGKTSVGKRIAARLGLPFIDSDHAIEESARMSIPEIFTLRGEAEFRAGERRVIARLLGERQQVIATGGGAFMDAETRARIRENGVSVWLRAELPLLMRRVLRRQDRPLLQVGDPETAMRDLMNRRYPVYAEADVAVDSEDLPHDAMASRLLASLERHLHARDGSHGANRHG